jgi:hypothetical protein
MANGTCTAIYHSGEGQNLAKEQHRGSREHMAGQLLELGGYSVRQSGHKQANWVPLSCVGCAMHESIGLVGGLLSG